MKYLIYIIIVFSLIGCKSKTIYVPVETVKTEYVERLQRDSIFMQDSVFVDRFVKGDSIFFIKEKYKYLYRDKLKVDTIYRDSLMQVPYPVVEIKEVNRLKTWQIILMCLGGILIGFVGYRLLSFFKRT